MNVDMASSRLRMSTTRSAHKKYLGDPSDPHFRPSSPLISRQIFTAQQEEDLRRACARVLSQVPHSDDETDDYMKHLARHITTKAPQERPQRKEKPKVPQPYNQPQKPALSLGDLGLKSQPDRRRSDETATLSDTTSRRDRDRTGESTPLTSAGITPGETGKRFFDSFSRPTTGSKGVLSRLDEKPLTEQGAHTFLQEPAMRTSIRVVPSTTKSMMDLKSSQKPTDLPPVKPSRSGIERTFLGNFRPEFNKSLPKLPKVGDSHSSMAIFEMGKTKGQHIDLTAQQNSERASASPETTPAKKQKFKIMSLFSRKNKSAQEMTT